MPGRVVGPGDEYDLLVAGGERLHLAVERHARATDEQQAVVRLDRLQRLGQLLLETLRVRLENTRGDVSSNTVQ